MKKKNLIKTMLLSIAFFGAKTSFSDEVVNVASQPKQVDQALKPIDSPSAKKIEKEKAILLVQTALKEGLEKLRSLKNTDPFYDPNSLDSQEKEALMRQVVLQLADDYINAGGKYKDGYRIFNDGWERIYLPLFPNLDKSSNLYKIIDVFHKEKHEEKLKKLKDAFENAIKHNKDYLTKQYNEERLETLITSDIEESRNTYEKNRGLLNAVWVDEELEKSWEKSAKEKAIEQINNGRYNAENDIRVAINNYVNEGGDPAELYPFANASQWLELCQYFSLDRLKIVSMNADDVAKLPDNEKPYSQVTPEKNPNLYRVVIEGSKKYFTDKSDELSKLNERMFASIAQESGYSVKVEGILQEKKLIIDELNTIINGWTFLKISSEVLHSLFSWSILIDALSYEKLDPQSALFQMVQIPQKTYLASQIKYYLSLFVYTSSKEEAKKHLDKANELLFEYITNEKGQYEDGALLEALPVWEKILQWNTTIDPNNPIDASSHVYQMAQKSQTAILQKNKEPVEKVFKDFIESFDKDLSTDKAITGKSLEKIAKDYLIANNNIHTKEKLSQLANDQQWKKIFDWVRGDVTAPLYKMAESITLPLVKNQLEAIVEKIKNAKDPSEKSALESEMIHLCNDFCRGHQRFIKILVLMIDIKCWDLLVPTDEKSDAATIKNFYLAAMNFKNKANEFFEKLKPHVNESFSNIDDGDIEIDDKYIETWIEDFIEYDLNPLAIKLSCQLQGHGSSAAHDLVPLQQWNFIMSCADAALSDYTTWHIYKMRWSSDKFNTLQLKLCNYFDAIIYLFQDKYKFLFLDSLNATKIKEIISNGDEIKDLLNQANIIANEYANKGGLEYKSGLEGFPSKVGYYGKYNEFLKILGKILEEVEGSTNLSVLLKNTQSTKHYLAGAKWEIKEDYTDLENITIWCHRMRNIDENYNKNQYATKNALENLTKK